MTQFVVYMPYGETLVDEHTTTYENPFKFSGKELDDVTSLYYYGARYMDPKSMCWYSLDRYMEKYPELSPYSFCAGNPVKITDVNGDSLFVLHAPNGASGFGHLAILIQDPDNGGKWALFSKNGTTQHGGIYGPNDKKPDDGSELFDSPKQFLSSNENPIDPENGLREYTEGYLIAATPQEDIAAIGGAKEELGKDYNLAGSNCAKTVQTALKRANKKEGYWFYGPGVAGLVLEKTPNLIYIHIKTQNQGKEIESND